MEELVVIEDRPWAFMFENALKHGELRTAASKLASRLKGYKTPAGDKIKPRTIKLADGSTAKGYHRSDFEEAWKRWLPASPPPTVTNVTNVTFPGEKGDVEGTGCVEGDVTGQGNVTDFPSKVTTVTTVTTNQGEGEDSGETDEYAALDCWRRHVADHSNGRSMMRGLTLARSSIRATGSG
jgi:hypothetical protein